MFNKRSYFELSIYIFIFFLVKSVRNAATHSTSTTDHQLFTPSPVPFLPTTTVVSYHKKRKSTLITLIQWYQTRRPVRTVCATAVPLTTVDVKITASRLSYYFNKNNTLVVNRTHVLVVVPAVRSDSVVFSR